MIQCPYCGADLDENARFCGKCLSLLVARHEGRGQEWPSWLHPYAALIVIAVISAGLLAFSMMGDKKPKDQGKPAADTQTETPADLAAAPEPPAPTPEPPPETNPPPGPALAPGDISFEEMAAYDREIEAILAESDQLTSELDRLLSENSESNLNALGDLTRQLQFQSQKMRKVKAPRVIQQFHNKLSNAQSILYRGYQKLMHYQKSGEVARLDEGRRDIETAKEKRRAALDEIAAVKQNLGPAPEPPPAVEPPPPAVEEPPAPEPPPPVRSREPDPATANEGKDAAGPCVPLRLVEMYPAGPTRDRIAASFAGQFGSSRVCGERPAVPGPEADPQPPGNGPETEVDGPTEGATPVPEDAEPPVYEDTPAEEIFLNDEPAQP